MKSNIGIIIYTNDPETIWNAFRLAIYSLTQQDTVKVFLLGKGVEAPNVSTDQFDVKNHIQSFVAAGGEMHACGTCLKIRNEVSSDMCPISTMADLYAIIAKSDKIISF